MAYLGKPSINRATGTSKDSFNGDGSTTAFTMTKTVHLVTDIEVFVDNVQQEPTTAYTVSATTLTFTEAPANGTNNVYVIHRIGNNDSMTIQSGISATLSDATISGTLTAASDVYKRQVVLSPYKIIRMVKVILLRNGNTHHYQNQRNHSWIQLRNRICHT